MFRTLAGCSFVVCIGIAALNLSSMSARADEALTVRLDWLPTGYQAPIWLAVDKGWFRDAGLDVSISDGNGSATTVQLIANGQFDVGHAALSNMALARNKGMKLVSIAGFFRKGDISLIVPKDSPINGPMDLKGKRIIYTASSLETPFLDSFFAAGGVKREEIDLINVDANAKVAQYLTTNVDGIISAGPTLALVQDKRPSRLVLFADFGLNLPSFGLVANEANLTKKSAALRQFASIVSGAWAYVLKGHEDEAIASVLRNRAAARLNAAVMRANLNVSLQFLHSASTEKQPIGVQTEDDWTAAVAILERAKLIPPGTKAREYFTNDYLDTNTIASIATR
jgi:NitT/TauT family transport system substrate-binding protein